MFRILEKFFRKIKLGIIFIIIFQLNFDNKKLYKYKFKLH